MNRRRQITPEEMQRPYGRLRIIADGGEMISVRCECGREVVKRKYAVLHGSYKSCGKDCPLGPVKRNRKRASEATRKRHSSGSRRAHQNKREFLSADLDAAEREQVRRIIESRTGEARHARETRREAIDLVIRDRRLGEMVCHAGTVETL